MVKFLKIILSYLFRPFNAFNQPIVNKNIKLVSFFIYFIKSYYFNILSRLLRVFFRIFNKILLILGKIRLFIGAIPFKGVAFSIFLIKNAGEFRNYIVREAGA